MGTVRQLDLAIISLTDHNWRSVNDQVRFREMVVNLCYKRPEDICPALENITTTHA